MQRRHLALIEGKQNAMQHGIQSKLVNASKLLEVGFDAGSRPSLRWLRTHTARHAIPHVRIGRLIFYDPDTVREHLERATAKEKAGGTHSGGTHG